MHNIVRPCHYTEMEHKKKPNKNIYLHLRAGKLWSKGLDSIKQCANSRFCVCFSPTTYRALINNQAHTKNSFSDAEVLGSFLLCWNRGLLRAASALAKRSFMCWPPMSSQTCQL